MTVGEYLKLFEKFDSSLEIVRDMYWRNHMLDMPKEIIVINKDGTEKSIVVLS